MKRKHLILLALAIAVWVGENIYFGWNATPQSDAEKFWDSISIVLFFWAIIGDILNGLTITKTINIAENHDHMQSDKLFLQIKKGATLQFGKDSDPRKTRAVTNKDIDAPLTGGITKADAK